MDVEVDEVQELNVLVFGGTRSGKTSLLTAMWDSVQRGLNQSSFIIEPDIDDHHILDEARENLQSAFELDKGPYWRAVSPTDFPNELRLYIRKKTTNQDFLTITFVDTPGEYSERQLSGLAPKFQDARCGILAVDSVELMLGQQEINPKLRRNRPGVIARGLSEWVRLSPDESTMLLVVALTKCETWLRSREEDGEVVDTLAEGQQLIDRFKEVYAEPLAVLAEHSDCVAVVVCPVQTVGNMAFEKYVAPSVDGGYPGEEYRRFVGVESEVQESHGYSPLDCDQPLRYLLNFALIGMIDDAFKEIDREVDGKVATAPWYLRWMVTGKIAEWMKEISKNLEAALGDSRDLARTVARFVKNSKSSPPFEVIQGKQLVERSFTLWGSLDKVL